MRSLVVIALLAAGVIAGLAEADVAAQERDGAEQPRRARHLLRGLYASLRSVRANSAPSPRANALTTTVPRSRSGSTGCTRNYHA